MRMKKNRNVIVLIISYVLLVLCCFIFCNSFCEVTLLECRNIDESNRSYYVYTDYDEIAAYNLYTDLESKRVPIQAIIGRTTMTYSEENINSNRDSYFLQTILSGSYDISLQKGSNALAVENSDCVIVASGANLQICDKINIRNEQYDVCGKNTQPDIFWINKNNFEVSDDKFCMILVFSDVIISKSLYKTVVDSIEAFFPSSYMVEPNISFFHAFSLNIRKCFGISALFFLILTALWIIISSKIKSKKNLWLILSLIGTPLIGTLLFMVKNTIRKQYAISVFELVLLESVELVILTISLFVGLKLHNKTIRFKTTHLVIGCVSIIIAVLLFIVFLRIAIPLGNEIKTINSLCKYNGFCFVPDWVDVVNDNFDTEKTLIYYSNRNCKLIYSGRYISDNQQFLYVSDYTMKLFEQNDYLPFLSTLTSRPSASCIFIQKNSQKVIKESDLLSYEEKEVFPSFILICEDNVPDDTLLINKGVCIPLYDIKQNSLDDWHTNNIPNLICTFVLFTFFIFVGVIAICTYKEKKETCSCC